MFFVVKHSCERLKHFCFPAKMVSGIFKLLVLRGFCGERCVG